MKIIFWNVDTQVDFLNKDGALYIEGAEEIKPNLKKLTDFAKEKDLTVINTMDAHTSYDEEISDAPDFINTFPKHCMSGSKGRNFIKETNIRDYNYSQIFNSADSPLLSLNHKNIIIYKNKFDVFEGNVHTEKLLNFINPNLVVVYGVATNVCVNYAVLGLVERGYEVIVVEDAIKELPNLPVQEIFNKWNRKGVIRKTTENIFEYINLRI